MIHLKLRTEYSFRKAYGRLMKVIATAEGDSIAITDGGTWGHVQFNKACRKMGKKPIFGVELDICGDATAKEKIQGSKVVLLAKDNLGISEINHFCSVANLNFYYSPRIDYSHLSQISEHLYCIIGMGCDLSEIEKNPFTFIEISPGCSKRWIEDAVKQTKFELIVCCDNYFPTVDDISAYQIVAGQRRVSRIAPMHIMNEDELKAYFPKIPAKAFKNTEKIAKACNASLTKGAMVKFKKNITLETLCVQGAKKLEIWPLEKEYSHRLDHELNLINEKGYSDYFKVIADLVNEAKKTMFVGPARGSSAGSLVCYLMGITDVDPIKHDLMFERFIDVTRTDIPDIDIDFPDEKRDEVFAYLEKKYGKENVGRLGTVTRSKPKSTMDDVTRELGLPFGDVNLFKQILIERPSGNLNSEECIQDTFKLTNKGAEFLEKFPHAIIATRIEGHARHSGMHAAAVLVTNKPISTFCSVDHSGSCQIDKFDSEELHLLKIDALGLRTLTVIEDCLSQIKKDREWLLKQPLNKSVAFNLINSGKLTGIFQFEGYALQNLAMKMKVTQFSDIVALTSLARPGPLKAGASNQFIDRRVGNLDPVPLDPFIAEVTKSTYGIIVFQEQVMEICRKVGKLGWGDVTKVRKAMGKSLGEEAFDEYYEKFKKGGLEQGVKETSLRNIWEHMNTFGSYAFNKSHAVSYGLISYWCALLKSQWPVEFAAACLRKSKGDEQTISLLRELDDEGIKFIIFDKNKSNATWTVSENGTLIGGIQNIKDIGPKMCHDIIHRRREGKKLTPSQSKLIEFGKTPFDQIFEGREKYSKIFKTPKNYEIETPLSFIKNMHIDGEHVVLARIKSVQEKDLNEGYFISKRNGQPWRGQSKFVSLIVEDDTGEMGVTIPSKRFEKVGKYIIEHAQIGQWFLWKGEINHGYKKLFVKYMRSLNGPMGDIQQLKGWNNE